MIGLRYAGAKKGNHFISLISFASMAGIAIGVIVLINVLSVINGFEFEVRERILGMVPHVVISDRGNGFKDWQSLEAKVTKHPEVVAASPFIDARAMFRHSGRTKFGLIQGILPGKEKDVSIVNDHMISGKLSNLKQGEFGIILGINLARDLRVNLNDNVTIILAEGSTLSASGVLPKYQRLKVVGLFEVKSELDNLLSLIHIKDAAVLTSKGDKVSNLRVTTKNVLDAANTAFELRKIVGDEFYVSDWNYTHGTLYRAVKSQKKMIFILLFFIIIVASFNLVSTLVMMVNNKRSDIAILRTIGASPATIMRIFIVQGSLNGFVGMAIGVVAGVTLAYNLSGIVSSIEELYGIQVLSGDVYPINFLPSILSWADVVHIIVITQLLSTIATIYPAWRGSRIKPAEALRYD